MLVFVYFGVSNKKSSLEFTEFHKINFNKVYLISSFRISKVLLSEISEKLSENFTVI